MEMHILHTLTSSTGVTPTLTDAVLAVFFVADANAQNSSFLNAINAADPGALSLDVSDLWNGQLNFPLSFFNYNGSLTTPPCTQIVNWFVVSQVIHIPPSQLVAFNNLWKNNPNFAGGRGNNRDLQELNGRTVLTQGSLQSCAGTNYVGSAFALKTLSLVALAAISLWMLVL